MVEIAKTNVIGLSRFSMVLEAQRGYPSLREIGHQEREKQIFDPVRMDYRIDLFERLLLPSLLKQDDQDFHFILLTTDNLPNVYRERVQSMIKDVKQISLFTAATHLKLDQICHRALHGVLKPNASKWATFRIDDDDALATSYISRLRRRMMVSTGSKAVSFTRGLQANINQGLTFTQDLRVGSSAGLALISHEKDHELTKKYPTVYQLGGHRKIGRNIELELAEGRFAYLRLVHSQNISKVPDQKAAFNEQRAKRVLKREFGLDGFFEFPGMAPKGSVT